MDSVTRENWRCWQRLQLPMTRYLNNLNLREIVRHLYQDQLLTLSEMESFSNDQRTAALNVIRLTSCLSRKGPNCIQLFLGCLKRAGDVSGRRDVLTAIASDPESPETIRVDVGKWLVTHTPVRAVDSVLVDLPEEGDGWGRGQEGWLAEVQHDGGRNGDEFSLESGFFSQEHQSAPEGTDSGLGAYMFCHTERIQYVSISNTLSVSIFGQIVQDYKSVAIPLPINPHYVKILC